MSDSIKKIQVMRAYYKTQEAGSSSEVVRELKQIKNEIRMSNDLNAEDEKPITNATHSPYAPDQPGFNKEVVYNSTEETDWKKVRSYEESKREAFVFTNLKRLNIL